MESFEITFFCLKKDFKECYLEIFNRNLNKFITFGERNLLEIFDIEEQNYIEIRLSIFDLVLKGDIFIQRFKELSLYVGEILNAVKEIYFATGIYELTYERIKDTKELSNFDELILKGFPILFFRPENDYEIGEIIYKDENVICRFNKGAQILY